MTGYIPFKDAIAALRNGADGKPQSGQRKMTVREAICKIIALDPIEAIPAETIVHCGQCKWYRPLDGRCTHPVGIINPPVGQWFYCKNGERPAKDSD